MLLWRLLLLALFRLATLGRQVAAMHFDDLFYVRWSAAVLVLRVWLLGPPGSLRLPITAITLMLLIAVWLPHAVALLLLLLPINRYLSNVNIVVINNRAVHVHVDVLEVVDDYLVVHGVDWRIISSSTGCAAGAVARRVRLIRITPWRLRSSSIRPRHPCRNGKLLILQLP